MFSVRRAFGCKSFGVLFAAAVAFGSPATSLAQPANEMNAIMSDTQRFEMIEGRMVLAWWLAEPFWRLALRDSKATPAQIESTIQSLNRYVVVAVIDGETGPLGAVKYGTAAEAREKVAVRNARGQSFRAIPEAAVDPDIKVFFSVFRPMLSRVLGPMGDGVHLFAFNGKSPDGQTIADASKEGEFSIAVGARDFLFRLPLGSALPPKYDAKSGEKFPGNYRYNPYTGQELGNSAGGSAPPR